MRKNDAPLYYAIKDAMKAKARFCMPSHSGACKGLLYRSCGFDYTEVDGLDNLLCADSVIALSEGLCAKAYGCGRSLYLTCGSTVAMHIALSVAKDTGGKILAVGHMHKSFWGGCSLLGINPISTQNVDTAVQVIEKANDISAVFFTSPDYYGNIIDIDKIINICTHKNILSVADSAHGAHFAFSKNLPESVSGKADITIVSFHKTMPVYTAGACINLKDDKYFDKAVYYRQLWHTTSPSYLVMASIDYAIALFKQNGEAYYKEIKEAVSGFANELKNNSVEIEKSADNSRLVLNLGDYSAKELNEFLIKKGIYAEAVIGNKLIFIITPFNSRELPLVAKEINAFKPTQKNVVYPQVNRQVVNAFGAIEFIDIEQGAGRVCMCEVGLYPPGVPYIKRGEVFTQKDIQLLCAQRNCLFGLVNGRLVVLQ